MENKVVEIIDRLKEASKKDDIVLLDYETNCDVLNTKKPLSHAYLVKAYVEGTFPQEKDLYSELDFRKSQPLVEKTKKRKTSSKSRRTKNKNLDNQTTLF